MIKLIQSLLGFKPKKSLILQQRNSLLKLLLILNIPSMLLIFLFQHYAPEQQMDEQFHYRQFREYYNGRYQVWDGKITTPPGLYYLQLGLSWLVGGSLWGMRVGNWVVFGNLFVVFSLKIYEQLDHNPNNLSRALNLAITPTIYFFNFLDYTDTASLSLVVMAFYYCLVGSSWRMGLCSLLSVYVRQNNIIWCMYLLVYRIICMYGTSIGNIKGNLFRSIIQFLRIILLNFKQILLKTYPQLLILPITAWYLHTYNNSRLLFGDHSNHPATFHPTQLLYLSLFIAVNLPIPPNDFLYAGRETLNRLYFSRHALAAYLFLLSVCIVVVERWTIVHAFLLADNRHYVFYMVRWFGWARFPLCVVYPFLFIFITRIIVNSNQKFIKFTLWLASSLLYLSLSSLVELRYFTIPFALLCFEIRNRSITLDVQHIKRREIKYEYEKLGNRMILTNLWKAGVNFVVFWGFLGRGWGRGVRFMW